MSNLSKIVDIRITINSPAVSAASFDNLMIVGPPPLNAVGAIPEVGIYYDLKSIEEMGYVTTGANADPSPVWRREFTLEGLKSIIISCVGKDAQGIWFNGVDYHIEGKPKYEHHKLQTVELTEGEDKPPTNIGEARAVKLAELSDACEAAIYAGVSVETTQGMEHFAMTLEDQTNIGNLMLQAQMGSPVLYHSDGELCRWFEPAEFAKVAQAVVTHKTYHTTLCNHLNTWVRRTDDIDEISKIRYDSVLPKDLADHMNGLLSDGR